MKRPNIVLFLAEDLDYEGLNCYDAAATGYTGLIHAGNSYAGETEVPTQGMLTPTIDTMAGNGAMFESYYCASPICTPARYSVLTGRFPERSPELIQEAGGKPATIWFNTPIMPGETLLPKQLKQSGYHTAILENGITIPPKFTIKFMISIPRSRIQLHGMILKRKKQFGGDIRWRPITYAEKRLDGM